MIQLSSLSIGVNMLLVNSQYCIGALLSLLKEAELLTKQGATDLSGAYIFKPSNKVCSILFAPKFSISYITN